MKTIKILLLSIVLLLASIMATPFIGGFAAILGIIGLLVAAMGFTLSEPEQKDKGDNNQ